MKSYNRDKELTIIKYNIDNLNKNIEYIVNEYGIFNPYTGHKVFQPKYKYDIPFKFLNEYNFRMELK